MLRGILFAAHFLLHHTDFSCIDSQPSSAGANHHWFPKVPASFSVLTALSASPVTREGQDIFIHKQMLHSSGQRVA